MAKDLDMTKSVYELTEQYPELIDIMVELGFSEISKTAMRNSIGRIMTIPKGAKTKNISMIDVVMKLQQNGFNLVGEMPSMGGKSDDKPAEMPSPEEIQRIKAAAMADDRTEILKSYLKRLGAGEDLESVRADFVKEFSEVDATEIMKAEQALMKEGTPIEEVQKLCDVHSALFHGTTSEEFHANTKKPVVVAGARAPLTEEQQKEALAKAAAMKKMDYSDKNAKAAELVKVYGHPLYTLTAENEALAKLIAEANEIFAKGEMISDKLLANIRELSIHYAKKGDLLYPHLKVKYGINGPSDVMWTVDDEIRDEMNNLAKLSVHDDEWLERLKANIKRADEMIYKEGNILFPICAVNFTTDEWYGIYQDSKDYAECFGVEHFVWDEAEKYVAEQKAASKAKLASDSEAMATTATGEIVMPGGHLTLEQLTALLNTVPIEITFVDADNINRYFNEGPKVFKRPGMAIDREVFSCHPPKIEPMVRSIIEDFRNGVRDSVPVWMNKNGKVFLVTYLAVRDDDKNYLGTVEVVQDMEFAREYFKNHE